VSDLAKVKYFGHRVNAILVQLAAMAKHLVKKCLVTQKFQYNDDGQPEVNWYCIEGGAEQLVGKMKARLKIPPTIRSRVIVIKEHSEWGMIPVEVEKGGSKNYDAVFSSGPLECLKRTEYRYQRPQPELCNQRSHSLSIM
jgi:hypothetical protein